MPDVVERIEGISILRCADDGPLLRDADDAVEVIGQAMWERVDWVVVPVGRVVDDFFRLRTGIAGAILQKFVNYRLGLVILGDLSRHTARSTALRDLVRESNRGRGVWFVADLDSFRSRLAPHR